MREETHTFNLARFETTAKNNFVRDLALIDLSMATVMLDGDAIDIFSLVVNGVVYDARLEWNVTLQGFAISSIERVSGP